MSIPSLPRAGTAVVTERFRVLAALRSALGGVPSVGNETFSQGANDGRMRRLTDEFPPSDSGISRRGIEAQNHRSENRNKRKQKRPFSSSHSRELARGLGGRILQKRKILRRNGLMRTVGVKNAVCSRAIPGRKKLARPDGIGVVATPSRASQPVAIFDRPPVPFGAF